MDDKNVNTDLKVIQSAMKNNDEAKIVGMPSQEHFKKFMPLNKGKVNFI